MHQPISVLAYSSICNIRNIFIETTTAKEGLLKVHRRTEIRSSERLDPKPSVGACLSVDTIDLMQGLN